MALTIPISIQISLILLPLLPPQRVRVTEPLVRVRVVFGFELLHWFSETARGEYMSTILMAMRAWLSVDCLIFLLKKL
jgi:hypothetical protein